RVATSPVALRTSTGADILGSNVSIWLGPPCIKRRTTALSVSGRSEGAAAERDGNSHGSDRPPRARLPTRRKSRREWRGSLMVNMVDPPGWRCPFSGAEIVRECNAQQRMPTVATTALDSPAPTRQNIHQHYDPARTTHESARRSRPGGRF